MYRESYEPHPRSEATLREEVAVLESRRFDAVEARMSFYRWLPLRLLVEIGQPAVALLFVVIPVATVVLAATITWPVALVGLVLTVLLSIYTDSRIEGWVAVYNARIDDRIRALLAAAAGEPT